MKPERKRKNASKSSYDLELCVPGVFDSSTHMLYLATLKPSFRRTSGISEILLSNVDNDENDRELNSEPL